LATMRIAFLSDLASRVVAAGPLDDGLHPV
jgi:hypothetical protein